MRGEWFRDSFGRQLEDLHKVFFRLSKNDTQIEELSVSQKVSEETPNSICEYRHIFFFRQIPHREQLEKKKKLFAVRQMYFDSEFYANYDKKQESE